MTHSTFKLRSDDAAKLQSWLRSTTLSHGHAVRAEIILRLGDGCSPTEISQALGVSRKMIYKWRDRYLSEGVKGLVDQQRPGRPTALTEEKIRSVLRMTIEFIPPESTHWSVRLMAKYAGISTWQVLQIWKAADLQPHRIKTFKISNDPLFAEKVVDVVGLYMNPPSNAVVLSVDEKTQIQALDRTQPGLPLASSQIGSRTHDYKRNGTANLYAAFNILTGEVIGKVTKRSRSKEFLAFMKDVEKKTPADQDLHVILDNHSAHKTQEVRSWVESNPRVHFHFTPTSASWLNAVEGWFAQLEKRSLYRGVFTSVSELEQAIYKFIKTHNKESAKPFRWTKAADAIISAVERAKKVLPY